MATYWENSCSFGLRYVSWYKYLIVSLVFSHLGFWSGNLFLIAPFPDLCLLVPFYIVKIKFASVYSSQIQRKLLFSSKNTSCVRNCKCLDTCKQSRVIPTFLHLGTLLIHFVQLTFIPNKICFNFAFTQRF